MTSNSYDMAALWVQGDFVIKGIMALLLLMSVASWYVIVTRTWRLMKLRRAAAPRPTSGTRRVSARACISSTGTARRIPSIAWPTKGRRRWIITP